jgi:predicted O-methyltransferase YrrM
MALDLVCPLSQVVFARGLVCRGPGVERKCKGLKIDMSDDEFYAFLQELEQFAAQNDARIEDRGEKMLNITHDTGEFLQFLVRAVRATRILEIGTSNGYSTLWLAHAVQPLNGKVKTLEISEYKAALARRNFERAGLAAWIDLQQGDASATLEAEVAGTFDLVFMDSNREPYTRWWMNVNRLLGRGGIVVADNALSHPHELQDFIQAVRATPGYLTMVVPVGKGEFVGLKDRTL